MQQDWFTSRQMGKPRPGPGWFWSTHAAPFSRTTFGEFGCLRSVDQPTGEGVPELMLSSLVVSPTGGPPGCARELLDAFGLCVPVTDTALEIIWRREQERVHAAYAVPPRVPPARLVPER